MKSHITGIQLITNARQASATDVATPSTSSWFDIVILDSAGALEPKKTKDGRSLVWLGQEISPDANEYQVQAGNVLTRQHELFGALDVGNVIAVRVCARFPGWENVVRDGRLVVRVAEQGPSIRGSWLCSVAHPDD